MQFETLEDRKLMTVAYNADHDLVLIEGSPNGDEYLVSSHFIDGGPAGWNAGKGDIFISDLAFSSASVSAMVIIHEIGHNWDDEYDEAGWAAISGWVESEASPGPDYVQAADDGWWYDSTLEGFVSDYARTNPREDFAESFTSFFMILGGLEFGNFGLADFGALPEKLAFMEGLLAAES